MTREEAIKWLKDIHHRFNPTGETLENEGGDVHLQAIDMAIEALSAERTGEWITEKGSYEIICSECGYEAFSKYGEWFKSDYCPTCGAKMKG